MTNPFDRCSSEYARFRPNYPPELYDYLLRGRPGRVLDVGAGTGKGSAPFLSRGVDVFAGELSASMASEGVRAILAFQNSINVTTIHGDNFSEFSISDVAFSGT